MPVPAVGASHQRQLLRDSVFVRIRDAIIDGTLQPAERLLDGELSAWLGVSRTPIREALARLEAAVAGSQGRRRHRRRWWRAGHRPAPHRSARGPGDRCAWGVVVATRAFRSPRRGSRPE